MLKRSRSGENNLECHYSRSFIGWLKVDEVAFIGPKFVFEIIKNVRLIRGRLKSFRSGKTPT